MPQPSKYLAFWLRNPVPDSNYLAQDGTVNSGVRTGEIALKPKAMLCPLCGELADKYVTFYACRGNGNHLAGLDQKFEDLTEGKI